MSKKIVLVGRYPPPVGGNTVHIQRLALRLQRSGHAVSVFDLYARCVVQLSELDRASVLRSRLGFLRCAVELFNRADAAVVHFHISAGSRFYLVAPMLLALTRGAAKRVLTIHSGSWIREFQRLSPGARWAVTKVLNTFDDIICVNHLQCNVLYQVVDTRLHVIPAFLPPEPTSEPEPVAARAFLENVDAVFVTSGCGTELYDFLTVIEGVELAASKLQQRLGLVIVTYAYWDPKYWPLVTARAQSSSVAVSLLEDLSPGEFVSLLLSATGYIRATVTDGDAVTIREAGALGLKVVASDATIRPEGTAVFPTGNAERLAETLVRVVQDPGFGRLATDVGADNFERIVDVYYSR